MHKKEVIRMSNILVCKTSALGDVVRTTPILRVINGNIFWLTSKEASELLPRIETLKILTPNEIDVLKYINFDLVLNLEEDVELAKFLTKLRYKKLIGVYYDFESDRLSYTDESKEWYDMSLISKYGKEKADLLKWENKKPYQEILFSMLGKKFNGEEYLLNYEALPIQKKDRKVVAIEKRAGKVWPMKVWPYYDELKAKIEKEGYEVIVLRKRDTIIEYIKDIDEADILICGDTLAMHLGIYLRKKVITLFLCTSPWEIYDYGRVVKIVNPFLKEAFYRRDYDEKLVKGITVDMVFEAFLKIVKDES
jgi:heptosyltransferase-2